MSASNVSFCVFLKQKQATICQCQQEGRLKSPVLKAMNLGSPVFQLPQSADPVKFSDPGQKSGLRSEDTVCFGWISIFEEKTCTSMLHYGLLSYSSPAVDCCAVAVMSHI